MLLLAASVCRRVAFEFVKKHGVDAVRLLRLPRNCGKVGPGGGDLLKLETRPHCHCGGLFA
jgi:hypothetical protein